MEALTALSFLVSLVVLGLLIVVLVMLSRRRQNPQEVLLLNTAEKIQQGTQEIARQVANRLDELNRQLGAIKTLSAQMEQFQRFLLSTKKRGAMGEVFLEEILSEVLPRRMFSLQDTSIAPSLRPDAVIYGPQGKICVDSKFPAENYIRYLESKSDQERKHYRKAFRNDLARHIDKVARYIVPSAGTVEFAVLYIPAESVFSFIIENEPEILNYARSKRVILASPNTFYYFLQILMTGLRQREVREKAEKILAELSQLAIIAQDMLEYSEKSLKQITHAHANAENLHARVRDFLNRVEQVSRMDISEE